LKPGDKCKITKRTFLHKGIFVHTGSQVSIKEIQDDGKIIGEYFDKEGFPHDISFEPADLELV
jgi:hypothetical protein